MKTFPLFLKTSPRRIVVVGGGEQAAAKIRLLLKTDAAISILADRLGPELHALAERGRISRQHGWTEVAFRPGDIVIIASEKQVEGGMSDVQIADLARAAGALVNVVDRPDLCDFYFPSIVDRDPVVIAIGTEGNAPLLARQIKTAIETMLEPRLGELAALAGRLRSRVAEKIAPRDRRTFWDWVFGGLPRQVFARGLEREGTDLVARAIEAGGVPHGTDARGFVSLVGAGAGGDDLITLRAVRRLQEADVIFYDRLVAPGILELARRDAERINVGKAPGAHSWPQERIDGVIASAAKQGKRVVRLKCGDPGIFGRVAEEIECLEANGVRWEIVPGVTAASAAAAVAGIPLTERGVTDTLILTTGRKRNGAARVDWNKHLTPGTAMAIYMGVGEAAEIRRQLREGGNPDSLSVDVMSCVGGPDQRLLRTSLGAFPDKMQADKIAGPSIIVIRKPEASTSERSDGVERTPLAASL